MSLKVRKEMSHGYNESEIFQQLKPKIDQILDKGDETQRLDFLKRIHQSTQVFWFLVQNYYYEPALKTKFNEQCEIIQDKLLRSKYQNYKKFACLGLNPKASTYVEFNQVIDGFISSRLVKENQSFKEKNLQIEKQQTLDNKDFATFIYMLLKAKEIFYEGFLPDQERFPEDRKQYNIIINQKENHKYDVTQRIYLQTLKKIILYEINNTKRNVNQLLEEATNKQKLISDIMHRTKKHLKKNHYDTKTRLKERGILNDIQKNELQKKKNQVSDFQIWLQQDLIKIPNQDLICVICLKRDEVAPNFVFLCSSCNVPVHVNCYQLQSVPRKDWYCDLCTKNLQEQKPCCLLCQQKSQILKLVQVPNDINNMIKEKIDNYNQSKQQEIVQSLVKQPVQQQLQQIKNEYIIKQELQQNSLQNIKKEQLENEIQTQQLVQENEPTIQDVKVEQIKNENQIIKQSSSSFINIKKEYNAYQNQWIHLSCLNFNNKITYKQNIIKRVSNLMFDVCKICNNYGVVVKCLNYKPKKDKDCYSKFHIDCGIKAGFNLNPDTFEIQCVYHSPCKTTQLIYNEHEIRKQNVQGLQKHFESMEKKQVKQKQQGFKNVQPKHYFQKTKKTKKKILKKNKSEYRKQKTLQPKQMHQIYTPIPKKLFPKKKNKSLECYQILKFFDKHTQQCMDVVRHWMTYQKDYSDRIIITIKPTYMVKLKKQVKNVFKSRLDVKNKVWGKLKKDQFDHKKYQRLRKQILYLYKNQEKYIEFLQDKADVQRCSCGQPENNLPMFQCDCCHQWFHLQCQNKNLNIQSIQNETTCCIKCEESILKEFNFLPSEINIINRCNIKKQ